MDLTRLTRASHRQDRPTIAFCGGLTLLAGRTHELCGPARRRLALWVARATAGPVMWIRPAWHPDRLHMAGVSQDIAPDRLLFVEAARPADLLWSMEEALRSGAVPLVVGDFPDPPALTPVRRLHLAAEAGAAATGRAPLALLLTPGEGGAPGIETRWRLEPAHTTPDHAEWSLKRLRARHAPPATWRIRRGANTTPEIASRAGTDAPAQSQPPMSGPRASCPVSPAIREIPG
ncbi:hypothetical protein roselon_00052 [Roseibacterium elongatum DSM 19469]|uniref:Protein ImuA n=1 Tax=Roseicyclus elongatus DSM 19469 TaxID=1294273 RepID=W8RN34_9RHOB|nr:hypothetical protein [Roseibacterium elongatum]AHM02519.1 hypothetical protein roselon_00052 [Roseibacterium elongatum DSM 19469]